MNRSTFNHLLIGSLAASVALCVALASRSRGDEEPSAAKPKVTVPAEDLANQLRLIVARLDDLLAKPEEFDDARKSRIAKESGVAAVVSLGLGLSDQDHSLKKTAPLALAATQALAKAED